MPPTETLQLTRQDNPVVEIPSNSEEVIQQALERRPDIKVARLAVAEADAQVDLARASGAPDLGAIVGLKRTKPASGSGASADWLMAAGITVSLPIFHHNQYAVEERHLMANEAKLLLQNAEDKARVEIALAITKLEQAKRNAELYNTTLIPASQDAVRMASLGFEQGELRFAEFIAEQRRLTDAQLAAVQANADTTQALIEFERAIGKTVLP